MTSLTSAERESILSWADDDNKRIWIYTSQPCMMRKLRKNPYFELVKEINNKAYSYNPIAIEGFFPLKMLTFRTKKRTYTDKQKKEMGNRLNKSI